MSAPRPARPNERFPWAVVTAAARPGRNSIVVAGAEEGRFAVLVALARRRSVPEVEQLLAPPLAPRDALRRVRDALLEPAPAPAPRAATGSGGGGGGGSGGGGGDASAAAGAAAGAGGDAAMQDAAMQNALGAAEGLPPVPLMQVGRGLLLAGSRRAWTLGATLRWCSL